MRATIICGSDINDYKFVSSYLRTDDFFVCCDSGTDHLKHLDIENPDLIIGDFDSSDKPEDDEYPSGEIIVLPRAKDDTDSVFAIKEAIKRGFDEILLIGALGRRIDHALVNIHALIMMYENGVKGKIVDDYSEIELIGAGDSIYITNEWEYFSLVALGGDAKGVSITGAKFCLDNADVISSYQYATSNEVVGEEPAKVSIKEGYLLVTKVRKGQA